jgi:hypothetical protein
MRLWRWGKHGVSHRRRPQYLFANHSRDSVSEIASACVIASNRVCSSTGLNSAATACASSISRCVAKSFLPVINTAGRPQPDAASALHSALPSISGRFISTTMHALHLGIALASKTLGRSKVRTLKPAACISLASDERTERSSSTTSTVARLRVAGGLGFRARDFLRLRTRPFWLAIARRRIDGIFPNPSFPLLCTH